MKLESVKQDIKKSLEEKTHETIRLDVIGKVFQFNRKNYHLPCYIGISDEHIMVVMMNATYIIVKNGSVKMNLKTTKWRIIKGLFKNQFMVILEDFDITLKIKIHRHMPWTKLDHHVDHALAFLDFANERAIKNHQDPIEVHWEE